MGLLLLAFVLLASGYVLLVPMFETPDEPSHLEYVAFLATTGRLPLYGPEPEVPGEGIQPPLFYLASLPLFRWLVDAPVTLRDELHRLDLSMYDYDAEAVAENELLYHSSRQLRPPYYFTPNPALAYLRHMRWPSVLLAALAIVWTYLAVLRLSDPPTAVLAAGLLGLSPQFLFRAAAVSNDAAAAALGAATFLVVALALTDERGPTWRVYVALGTLIGLGLLTKLSVLVGGAVAAATVMLIDARPSGERARDAALGASACLVLGAPFLIWSWVARGDPLGMGMFWDTADQLTAHDAFGGTVAYFTGMYWRWTFESYWARFGWLNVYPSDALYLAFHALTWTAVLGFALASRRPGRRGPHQQALRRYLVAAVLVTVASHLYLNLRVPQPQGRHLFPVAPEIACLMATGLLYWTGRSSWRSTMIVLVPLAGVAGWCLLGVIVPAYALPTP